MNVAADEDGICLGWQVGCHWADVVLAVVVHDVVGCDECRYISSCFAWQVGVYFPVILAATSTMDGLCEFVWATVVGCDNQVPVAKDAV